MAAGNSLSQKLRWRLGMRVAAAALESGSEKEFAEYYSGRVTDCTFLDDPHHYEYPRAQWVLDKIKRGVLLEAGCGNGGMTRLIAEKADQVLALDISEPSLSQVTALGLKNVTTVKTLLDHYSTDHKVDVVVMSEVIEHLRSPEKVLKQSLSWLKPGGTLLLTTPNGHWESDEHLHEFNLQSLSLLLSCLDIEAYKISYLRDAQNRRRWLTAEIITPVTEASPDNFHNRVATARARRKGGQNK